MPTDFLSCAPDGGINEDLVTVFEHDDGLIDLIVLDGATSVADTDYVDPAQGDVAWFTHAFAAALEEHIAPGVAQAQAVRQAVDAVRAAYLDAGGRAAPLYAHPLAALTWIRIRPAHDHLALQLYCLGDCKALAIHADGSVVDLDPYVNPQEAVLQAAMAALSEEGVLDASLRRARLLPMLRARRESQHTAPAPNVLCLAPQGPFAARELAVRLPADAAVLGMTDGFCRLADVYRLLSLAELARRCRDDGLAVLMDELRSYEAAATAGAAALKQADDASVVIWTASAQPGNPA